MQPYVVTDGLVTWLRTPYGGPDLAVIEMEAPGTGWQPAYLDWDRGQRVAQIRWNGPLPDTVNLRVNGEITGYWQK